jgi:hypothetical protein
MATPDALIADYLDRLRQASTNLPARPRAELLDDIGAHLAETVDPTADEAQVRQALDELGTPEEIVAAAVTESAAEPTRSAGQPATRTGAELAYDVFTVLVLLIAGFPLPVLGWIAGLVMLWSGPRWGTRDKWVGTLVWPVAAIVVVAALLADHVSHGRLVPVLLLGAVLAVAVLAGGFAYLLRVAARSAPRLP